MPRGSRPTFALALAVALHLLAAAPAQADNPDRARARALLVEGNQLLDDGDPAGALDRFERAYKTYPSPALLLNIGTALRALDRHAEASNSYARWLRATRRPQHRAEVEEALAARDKIVGRIVLELNEPGAAITVGGSRVDDQIVDGVLRLDPGAHELVAQKDGFKPAIATVLLAAGEARTVRLVLEPSVLPRPDELTEAEIEAEHEEEDDDGDDDIVAAGEPAGDPVSSSLRVGGLIIGGAGLLSVAVGFKFGLDARRLSGEVDAAAAAGETAAVNDKIEQGERAENRFIAFTAVGGAAIIAGGVLYAIGHLRQGDRSERSLAIAPAVQPDLIGLAVSGGF